MKERRRVFVAMPFKSQYDQVLELIKKASYNLNLEVVHIGEQSFVGSIINHIRSEIESSDLMVAIVTEENGNVYYEIGLAHCQMKPVVLLTDDPDKLKFDLKDHRAIKYDITDPFASLPELTRLLASCIEPQPDLGRFLANVYVGYSGNPNEATHYGLNVILRSLTHELSLEPPVKFISHTYREHTNDHAIEIEDFMGVRVKAIVDVNGGLRAMRRIE
jgi:hypothetical protein